MLQKYIKIGMILRLRNSYYEEYVLSPNPNRFLSSVYRNGELTSVASYYRTAISSIFCEAT